MRFIIVILAIATTSLAACDRGEPPRVEHPILIYFSRNVSAGDKFDIHWVHGLAVESTDYKAISNPTTEADIFRYEGQTLVRDAQTGDLFTHDHFANPDRPNHQPQFTADARE